MQHIRIRSLANHDISGLFERHERGVVFSLTFGPPTDIYFGKHITVIPSDELVRLYDYLEKVPSFEHCTMLEASPLVLTCRCLPTDSGQPWAVTLLLDDVHESACLKLSQTDVVRLKKFLLQCRSPERRRRRLRPSRRVVFGLS